MKFAPLDQLDRMSYFEVFALSNFDGGVPDSTAMWKIRLHAEDDAWPRKQCIKTLHGNQNNIVAFEPELEALAA